MRPVLIINYYWPPAGGAGVQRWLMFCKYLPKFGVQPHVYVPRNPSYPVLDASLEQHISANAIVLKKPIVEPYALARSLQKNKTNAYQKGQFDENQSQSILSKMLIWIRGNLFIPDARMFWIRPSVKFLQHYIQSNQIKTIVSTGPPHSLHLIGKRLKQKNPTLFWVADFRDPWTQISYHKKLKLNRWAKAKHLRLEKQVLQNADLVLSTSYTDAKNFKQLGARRVEVITNGFDFNSTHHKKQESNIFRLVYSGGLESLRNPNILWQAVQSLRLKNSTFASQIKLIFYGNLSKQVKESLQKYDLMNLVEEKGYVSHKESIQGIFNSDLLWLSNFNQPESKGIIPGKLFEYLGTGNRILSIGPEGADVEQILLQTKSGKHFTYKQNQEIERFLLSEFMAWQNNSTNTGEPSSILQFTRENLSRNLANLLLDSNSRV